MEISYIEEFITGVKRHLITISKISYTYINADITFKTQLQRSLQLQHIYKDIAKTRRTIFSYIENYEVLYKWNYTTHKVKF